jgi:UDP-N-acetylglucosamine acyltransferase
MSAVAESDVQIDPRAAVAPGAKLGRGVVVGPWCAVGPDVVLGDHVRLISHAVIDGHTRIGEGATIYPFATVGMAPQDLKYKGEPTETEIGARTIIREHVTIHRGTTHSWETRIGDHNFLMAHSHIAHDCRIGNHCIIANGALLAGHCILEDNVYLSGNCALHQFVRVGRLALLSGVSASTKDIPPFIIQQRINCVVGVNVVGMRRAGIPSANIEAVRRAFHLLYRSHMVLPAALTHIERDLGHIAEVTEMLHFIRASSRGITLHIDREAAA